MKIAIASDRPQPSDPFAHPRGPGQCSACVFPIRTRAVAIACWVAFAIVADRPAGVLPEWATGVDGHEFAGVERFA
jgi:hypothetical protein